MSEPKNARILELVVSPGPDRRLQARVRCSHRACVAEEWFSRELVADSGWDAVWVVRCTACSELLRI